jgi:streptogramin lyase
VAVGEGAVWVTTSFARNVIRVDADHPTSTRTIPVGDGLNGIAVGEGAVWVADTGDKSLRRINPKTYNVRRIGLGVEPGRVTVGGGSVWVTVRLANQLYRINPKTLEVRERVETGTEPFALDVANGDAVWVTLLDQDDGAVQRVSFSR